MTKEPVNCIEFKFNDDNTLDIITESFKDGIVTTRTFKNCVQKEPFEGKPLVFNEDGTVSMSLDKVN